MRSTKLGLTLLAVFLFAAPALHAGPYGDELSKCMVESTTATDRVEMVKWMFAALSAHPDVKPLSTTTPEMLDASNKKMAELIVRLLAETCRDQAKKALQYEGQQTLEAGFQLLGKVAAQELFASPEVEKAMSGLEKHVDVEKLKPLFPEEEESVTP